MGFGPPQGVVDALIDISAVNFSAGTTNTNLASVVFSNSGGVSFGINGSTITATVGTNYAGLNSGATNCSVTVNTSGVSVNLPNYLTTAALSTGALYASSNTYLTSSGTHDMRSLSFRGDKSITVGISASEVVFSVGAYITTARASTDAIGLNTANTNVTWTVNSSGISINATGYAGTVSGATNCSVTANSAGVSVNVNLGTISSYANLDQFANTQTMTLNGASVSHCVAFQMPSPGSFSFIRIPVLMTTQTGSIAANASITTAEGYLYSTWNAVLYTLGTGANSKSLVFYTSSAGNWTFKNRVSAGGNANSTLYSITQQFSADAEGSGMTAGTSTQYSQTAASATLSTGFITNFSSLRWLDIRFANTLSAGPYWLVLGYSSSSTTSGQGASAMTNCSVAYSNHYGASQVNSWFEVMGNTAGSSAGYLGGGVFSTAGGGTTTSLGLSNLSSTANNPLMYFQLLRSA